MSVWERFENIVDKTEVNQARVDFAPIKPGRYKATLKSAVASENKDGLPMFKGAFYLVEENDTVYYNQTLQNLTYPAITAKNIKKVVVLLNQISGRNYEFDGMAKLDAEITRVNTECVGKEFDLVVSYDAKDTELKYPNFKVIQTTAEALEVKEDDLPF